MKEKIESFFTNNVKDLTEYLSYGAKIRYSLENSAYVVNVNEDLEVSVDEAGSQPYDLDIQISEEMMNELLASENLAELQLKMIQYTREERRPSVTINMDRTEKNAKKLFRLYIDWLRRSYLLH